MIREQSVKKVSINYRITMEDEISFPFYYYDDEGPDPEHISDSIYQFIHEQAENCISLGAYDVNISNVEEIEND